MNDDLLQILYKTEKEFIEKLKCIQMTIAIFGGVHEPELKQLEAQISNLNGTHLQIIDKPIETTKPEKKAKHTRKRKQQDVAPSSWNADMSWNQKALFLIHEIKEGSLIDLTDKLLQYAPKEDRKKASAYLSKSCYDLGKRKLISGKPKDQDNKKFIYFLPK